MFYNVENLFDTVDGPNTKDEEFLPLSEKKWGSYRYNYKLKQLEKVFNKIIEKENEKNLPDIIGLCEVENKLVIEDLLKTDVFKNHNYSIIHKQSPDGRGIDCALLVNSKFEVLQNDFIQINNPKESRTTREIVYSKLKFKNQIINVFVNGLMKPRSPSSKNNLAGFMRYERVFFNLESDSYNSIFIFSK